MARTKVVDGVRFDFTPEEEAAADAEQVVWEAGAFDRAIANLRSDRTNRLASTDWCALQDVTMSDAMTAYRQDLRDLPAGLSTKAEIELATLVIEARRSEYGPVADQIEFITENGLEAWQTKVSEIKLQHPK